MKNLHIQCLELSCCVCSEARMKKLYESLDGFKGKVELPGFIAYDPGKF